jgi:hypothetical protein
MLALLREPLIRSVRKFPSDEVAQVLLSDGALQSRADCLRGPLRAEHGRRPAHQVGIEQDRGALRRHLPGTLAYDIGHCYHMAQLDLYENARSVGGRTPFSGVMQPLYALGVTLPPELAQAAEEARRELETRSPESNRRVAAALREMKSRFPDDQQRIEEMATRFEQRAAAATQPDRARSH